MEVKQYDHGIMASWLHPILVGSPQVKPIAEFSSTHSSPTSRTDYYRAQSIGIMGQWTQMPTSLAEFIIIDWSGARQFSLSLAPGWRCSSPPVVHRYELHVVHRVCRIKGCQWTADAGGLAVSPAVDRSPSFWGITQEHTLY